MFTLIIYIVSFFSVLCCSILLCFLFLLAFSFCLTSPGICRDRAIWARHLLASVFSFVVWFHCAADKFIFSPVAACIVRSARATNKIHAGDVPLAGSDLEIMWRSRNVMARVCIPSHPPTQHYLAKYKTTMGKAPRRGYWNALWQHRAAELQSVNILEFSRHLTAGSTPH